MDHLNIPQQALDDYVRAYMNAARRKSYAKHPERVMRQRLTSAVNLLTREGLIDRAMQDCLLSQISASADAQNDSGRNARTTAL